MTDAILGAGIAGLGAAHAAKQLGRKPVIYEAAERPGGLLDSFKVNGWQFDNGVHLSFANEPEVRAVFDQTPYIEHEAAATNWDNGHWLRHPVQNNMFPLPADQKTDLIADLVARPDIENIANYHDWLTHQYGPMIAARWPLPYTRKYWTIDAADMGIDWIGKRMRRADLREVLFGAMSQDVPSTYYISQMRYPERGGYGAFIKPLLEDIDLRPNHRATLVDWKKQQIHFDNGTIAPYDHLISTMPLPALIDIMPDVPDAVKTAACTLFATRVDLISVGLNRADISPTLWFYIYDPDIMAARVYSPSRKSPYNAPSGCSALQFEIYSSVRRPQTATVQAMKDNCLFALEKMGLATTADIQFMHHKHLPYGNVVFDLGMEARRDIVRAWIDGLGIQLAGRFGEWDYLWSNQSMMSGMKAAQALFAPIP